MSDTGTTAATTDTGTTATTTATATTTTPNWYDGLPTEDLGYLQNRGLDKGDVKSALLATMKAHREAERLIGAPSDKVVRLPKDSNDVEAIANLYTKLGVPADEKGYDFSGVKFADGTGLDEGFTTDLGKALRAAGVAKDQAAGIAKVLVALGDREEASSVAEKTAALNAEREALKINWGSNVEANTIVARNAAAAFGPKIQAAVDALEGQAGYAAVLEMFREIGSRIAEPAFMASGIGGGRPGVVSASQAQATLDSNLADATWRNKLDSGDRTTIQEFDNLTRVITAAQRQAA